MHVIYTHNNNIIIGMIETHKQYHTYYAYTIPSNVVSLTDIQNGETHAPQYT